MKASREPTSSGKRRRFYLRLSWFLIVAFLAAYISRAWLLRLAAAFLVQEAAYPPGASVVLWEPDATCRQAAELFDACPGTQLVLIGEWLYRSERLGCKPDPLNRARKYLELHAVPPQAILIVSGQGRTDWDRAQSLRGWLDANQTVEVSILCQRFHGRALRSVFRSVLAKEQLKQIQLVGVPDLLYDETNWWQSKSGALAFFDGYVRLIFKWTCGAETDRWREWDPDEYEKTLTTQH
jgi:hypothetical protein